jgi:hypothetical protein
MKTTLILAMTAIALLFASCSKKTDNNSEPVTPKPPVETIPTLTVQSFAGGGKQESTDGTGTNAQFYQISKLTSDKAGNVYVLEPVSTTDNHLYFKIRKVAPSGVTSTLFNSGYEEFVNNKPVHKSKIYRILDIAADPNGVLYVLANLTDYSTTPSNGGWYYQEIGVYKFDTSTGGFVKVLISSTTSGDATINWAAPATVLNNITVDASGNVYGAFITGNSTPGKMNVYKISSGSGTLMASVDGGFPGSLYAQGNGEVYSITTTGIVKISGSQSTSTLYTFQKPITAIPATLSGNQNGTIYSYGDLYSSSKELKGSGFYKVKSDGTVTNGGIITSNPVIWAATADQSGNIYYATHPNGFVIQKVTVN